MKCRFCQTQLKHVFLDLGSAPPSNSFLTEEKLNLPEVYYPLKVYLCHRCFLVQLDEYKKSTEIFNKDYVYFSSMSASWLEHCRQYVEDVTKRFKLNQKSQVIEIASNDGGLLQYFKEKDIPCFGIEPAKDTARAAQQKGIRTLTEFFDTSLARKLKLQKKEVDLIVANNVLAHVPNLNDFVRGIEVILKKNGVATFEFPHLLQLIEQNQFDTIYQEHFSYFSFLTVRKVFAAHQLDIFDVEEIPTHGGSLRLYVKHQADKTKEISSAVNRLIQKEKTRGMDQLKYYQGFSKKVAKVKYDFLKFLLEAQKNSKKVVGYGAAAKGNTLLNFCGVKNDLISFVIDKAASKQGKYLPGSRIPVVSEDKIKKFRPDYVIIFSWNIKAEIMEQLKYIKDWHGKFVVPIPKFIIK